MSATVPTDASQIITEQQDGVVVLRPVGGLDRQLADEIRRCALEANAPVVVDLSDCILIDPASVDRLTLGGAWQRPPMSVVCHRASGRELLVRAGVHRRLPIFAGVEEAVEDLRPWTRDAPGWPAHAHGS